MELCRVKEQYRRHKARGRKTFAESVPIMNSLVHCASDVDWTVVCTLYFALPSLRVASAHPRTKVP